MKHGGERRAEREVKSQRTFVRGREWRVLRDCSTKRGRLLKASKQASM